MLIALEIAVLVAVGILSMLVSTMTGGGTNVVLIPVLILVFHFPPGEAIGTSFMALTAGSTVAAIRFFRRGHVDVRRGVLLGASAIPGVVSGSLFSFFAQDNVFQMLIGLVVIGLSATMLLRGPAADGLRGSPDYDVNMKMGAPMLFLAGVFVGVFGQGGGLVIMPVMQFLGFPIAAALGTMRIIALLMGGTAFVTRLAVAQVDVWSGLALAAGSVIGGFLGAEIGSAMKAEALRLAVAVLIGSLGVALVLEAVL